MPLICSTIWAERGRSFMRTVPSGSKVGVTTSEMPISRCLSGSVSMDLSAWIDLVADFLGDGGGAACSRVDGGGDDGHAVDDGNGRLFVVLGDEGGIGDLAGEAAFGEGAQHAGELERD